MSDHAHTEGPPPTRSISPQDAALSQLGRIEQLLTEMRDVQKAANTPARLRTITFTPTALTQRDETGPSALSVALINPTSVRIYIGLGGERAQPNNHAFVMPPSSGMVIPVAVDQVDLGADPTDLGENTATVFWLRFPTVQPFQMWSV